MFNTINESIPTVFNSITWCGNLSTETITSYLSPAGRLVIKLPVSLLALVLVWIVRDIIVFIFLFLLVLIFDWICLSLKRVWFYALQLLGI